MSKPKKNDVVKVAAKNAEAPATDRKPRGPRSYKMSSVKTVTAVEVEYKGEIKSFDSKEDAKDWIDQRRAEDGLAVRNPLVLATKAAARLEKVIEWVALLKAKSACKAVGIQPEIDEAVNSLIDGYTKLCDKYKLDRAWRLELPEEPSEEE